MAPNGDGLSPEEAFRLLGDEMRTAILRAVWSSPEDAISFSTIRERAGGPDSGKFNYHLKKLTGHFLAKDEDGYRLTQAGREVVRAVMAGAITQRPGLDPVAIDGTCVDCGGGLRVRYDEYASIECVACGRTVMWNEFPPAGLVDRSPEEVASAFDHWTRTRIGLAMDGICPNCARETTTEILDSGAETRGDTRPADDDRDVATMHRCVNCKYEASVPLFGHVLRLPAVVSFYDDANVDITDMASWEQQALASEFTEAVITRDPWRARVTIPAAGQECRVTLDEHLDVVAVVRSNR